MSRRSRGYYGSISVKLRPNLQGHQRAHNQSSDTIKDVADSSIRDIALIGAAQQVEHHEIAVYGTLRRWAEILGLTEDAAVLEFIEEEEGQADDLLSEIAERVNFQAAA